MTDACPDPVSLTDSPVLQNLGGAWRLTPSVSEAWRFRRLHEETSQPVGAFARTSWIPARVPGSVHDDLIQAGLIPDPNFGLSSLEAEWVSARQWVYRRSFRAELPPSARLFLCFAGMDYSADVYLNGQHLGGLAGTHTPRRFDVSGLDCGADRPGTGQLALSLRNVTGMTLLYDRRPVSWPAPGQAISLPLPAAPCLLRAELHDAEGQVLARAEQWIARTVPQPFAALARLPQTTLEAHQAPEGLVVENTGAWAAPWVSVEAPAGVREKFSDNGFALLPGEQRLVQAALYSPDGRPVPAEVMLRSLNTTPVTVKWSGV